MTLIKAFITQARVLRNSTLKDYLSSSPTYIFHHIPRCGGSSSTYALSNWFVVVRDYRPSIVVDEKTDEYLRTRVDITRLRSRHCLCSHFEWEGNFLHQRYPEALAQKTRHRVFTFVRDPLQVMISLYYYERKNGYNEDMALEDFLIHRGHNYIANRLPCNEDNYEEVLSRYFFIGITEYLQESFDYLASILNKRRVRVPLLNRAERDTQSQGISAAIIQEFKRNNSVDYKIYEYSLNKFRRLRTNVRT